MRWPLASLSRSRSRTRSWCEHDGLPALPRETHVGRPARAVLAVLPSASRETAIPEAMPGDVLQQAGTARESCMREVQIRCGHPAPWVVLAVLLHTGREGQVPARQQVRQSWRARFLRCPPEQRTDSGTAAEPREDRRHGGASGTRGAVVSSRGFTMKKYRIATVAEILGIGVRHATEITGILRCRLPGEMRRCQHCKRKRRIMKPIWIDEQALRRVASKCGRLERLEKLERDGSLARMGTEIT
jgi:hypothetical protein